MKGINNIVKRALTKETVMYLIFGVLTTIINILTFDILNRYSTIGIFTANIIAWIVGVLFAYITNRKWVFSSKSDSILKEFNSFVIARLATGVLDQAIITIASIITTNSNILLIVKIISNVIVVVFNYILSKLIVFKRKA